jgi:hypothetical protein
MNGLKEAIAKYKTSREFDPVILRDLLVGMAMDLVKKRVAEIEVQLLAGVDTKVQDSINFALTTMLDEKLHGEKGDTPTEEQLLALIQPLIPEPIPGNNGHTPTTTELLSLIKPLIKIPTPKDGHTPTQFELTTLIKPLIPPAKDGSPDTPKQIANKLNTTTDSVNVSVIRGLEKRFDSILASIRSLSSRDRRTTPQHGGGDSVQYIDLSAQLNDVLKTFTIPAHRKIVQVSADSAPFNAFRPTIDFTHTRTSITFTSQIDETITLATGHSLVVTYTR